MIRVSAATLAAAGFTFIAGVGLLFWNHPLSAGPFHLGLGSNSANDADLGLPAATTDPVGAGGRYLSPALPVARDGPAGGSSLALADPPGGSPLGPVTAPADGLPVVDPPGAVPPGTPPPGVVLPPVVAPPVALPPILPPIVVPPIVLPPILPPVVLPPVVLPPIVLPPIALPALPPIVLPPLVLPPLLPALVTPVVGPVLGTVESLVGTLL